MRFDVLESRRLLAGLDVLVYSDADGSRDQNSPMELGLAKKVVYVDLNRNGSHDRNEPISITNSAGVASFSGLPASQVEVRLLGAGSGPGNGLVQTSPVRPSTTESLITGVAVDEILYTFGGDEFLGRSGNQLQRFAADGRLIGEGVAIPGHLIDSAFSGNDGWLLIDSDTSERELYRLVGGDLTKSSIDATHFEFLESLGGGFVAWDALDGLVRLNQAGTEFGSVIEISKGGDFELIRSLGSDRVVLQERLDSGTRLSVHRIDGDVAQLEAERIFAGHVVSWMTSASGDAIFVDTSAGVHVVDTINGLASRHVFASATSPILFDPVASILYTGDSANSSSLRAWDPRAGQAMTSVEIGANTTDFGKITISSDGRVLVAPSTGGLVVRSVSEAAPIHVDLSTGPVPRSAIGVQIVASGTPLELPKQFYAIDAMEDQESEIRLDQLFGDLASGIFAVVLQQPERGVLEWSVETGGTYRPFLNFEGADGFTVALFDGRNWSLPQRVGLTIQGQNDPPTGIRLPYRLEIRENEPGAVVGPVLVDDVDAGAAYRWSVDDQRFEVLNGVLKLRDGQYVTLQSGDSVRLTVRAEEVGSGDVVETTANLRVNANPQQGEFFVASQYTVPENQAGVSLGYVYVRGALPPEQYAISVSDSRFEVVNGLFKLRDSVALSWETGDAIQVTLVAQATTGEQYSKETLVRVIRDRSPTIDPNDVDGDGFLTPIDVLILINHINAQGSGASPQEGEPGMRIDIDGDGHVSPIDVLILINVINNQVYDDAVVVPPSGDDLGTPSGEGEGGSIGWVDFDFMDDITTEVRSSRRPR
ncbi:MAG: dockerin type I domain-containing protein [Pirellula sp.]|nr:dockerin type I domain-containing protein [Pirellula sp.]